MVSTHSLLILLSSSIALTAAQATSTLKVATATTAVSSASSCFDGYAATPLASKHFSYVSQGSPRPQHITLKRLISDWLWIPTFRNGQQAWWNSIHGRYRYKYLSRSSDWIQRRFNKFLQKIPLRSDLFYECVYRSATRRPKVQIHSARLHS